MVLNANRSDLLLQAEVRESAEREREKARLSEYKQEEKDKK